MKRLGFIGAGNMGQALAQGLIAQRLFKAGQMLAADVEPDQRRKFTRATGVPAMPDNLAVVRACDVVILAVKPQTIDAVLAGIGAGLAADGPKAARKLFISIAAGVPLARLEAPLGETSRVIRVMPNAPAMVGQGMAALVRGTRASKADQALALKLFRAVGQAVALTDESLLDAVTALSGSGPAYVYLFIKALAEAATAEGLPKELALAMALQTVRGAAKQMRNSRLAPNDLIRIVASPGGTTEAALAKFAERGFVDVVGAALQAAAARSRELGRPAPASLESGPRAETEPPAPAGPLAPTAKDGLN